LLLNLICTVLISCPALVHAEEFFFDDVEEEVPMIKAIQKGTPIPEEWNSVWPFNGAILNDASMATILADKKMATEECKLTIDYELKKQATKYDWLVADLQDVHVLTIEKHDALMSIKESEVDRLENIILQDSGSLFTDTLLFVGGIVLGSLATIAIMYAIAPAFQ